MNCTRVRSLLSAFLDRELGGDQMIEVQQHLRSCTPCSDELESLRRIKQALSASPVVEPSEDLVRRTHAAVFSTRQKRAAKSPVPGLVAMASALVAAFLAVSAAQNTPHSTAAAPEIRAAEARVSPMVVSGSDPFGGYAPTIPASVRRD
ncbi:MAG: zf-HC2 domain-containing protein [Fimbriimonadaceae bacterium]|nr:zf-HC2 domain-containing protein [Fimbriimonadaceae bacterium]